MSLPRITSILILSIVLFSASVSASIQEKNNFSSEASFSLITESIYLAANQNQKNSGLASAYRRICGRKLARRFDRGSRRWKRARANCVDRRLTNQDADGDGFNDNRAVGDIAQDNCPNISNPTQTDTDSNGTGDACGVFDVAIGDGSDGDNNGVWVFFDVLNAATTAGLPAMLSADLYLDPDSSGVEDAKGIIFSGDMLIIASKDNDLVQIYNDYRNNSDGDTPDVTLDNAGSNINAPIDIRVHDNHLVVCNDSNDLTIYDLDGIADADPPKITLDNGGSGIDDCNGIAISDNGRLFVADESGNVRFFDDFTNLADGAAPTGILAVAGDSKRVDIIDGNLYACTDNSESILVYNGVDSLADGDPFDAALAGPSMIEDCLSVHKAGGRVYVANGDACSSCQGESPIVGFDGTPTSFQSPDVMLGNESGNSIADDVEKLAGNDSLLCANSGDFKTGICFLNPGSLTDNQAPDIILNDFRMSEPMGVAFTERTS